MADYIPTDWKDEIVDGAGNVVQKGTPLSAANLKKLEAGVEGAVAAVVGKVDGEVFDQFKTATTSQLAETANKNPIYLTDYAGADKTGVTPSTNALNLAIDDAILQRRKIVVPQGTFVIDEGIIKNLRSLDLLIEGESNGEGGLEPYAKTRILWRGGVGTLFTFTSGRNVRFKNIEISGYDSTKDSDVLVIGSVGIKSQSSLIFENCTLIGFDKIAIYDGGFYHKFIKCNISFAKIAFSNFNANNIIFDTCKISTLEVLLTVTGGSGPISVTNCSLEKFTKNVFSAISGSSPLIYMSGSYIENYPGQTPPKGIEGDFNSSFIFNGFGSVVLMGNNIFTDGIRRVIYSNGLLKHVTSLGNSIMYSPKDNTLDYYIFGGGSIESITCNDVAYGVLPGGTGTFIPKYTSALTSVKPSSSKVYDPFIKKGVSLPLDTWIPLTLLNGWVKASVTDSPDPSYRINENKVEIRGILNGVGATADHFATLPEGYFNGTTSLRRGVFDIATNTLTTLRITTARNMIIPSRLSQIIIDVEY